MQLWQERISLANGEMPTYDDCDMGIGSVGGLFDKGDIAFNQYAKDQGTDLSADYISLFANTKPFTFTSESSVLRNSGNAILKAVDIKNGKHYGHLLFEKDYAVDKKANALDDTHEHDDFGSFMLAADAEWLAIDPPYLSFGYSGEINTQENHNIANGYSSVYEISTHGDGDIIDIRPNGFSLAIDIRDNNHNIADRAIIRSIDLYKTNGIVYYFLDDKLKIQDNSEILIDGLVVKVNGNGSNENGEHSFLQTDFPSNTNSVSGGRIYKWNHPCVVGRNTWGLLAHSAAISQLTNDLELSSNSTNNRVHGSGTNIITDSIGTKSYAAMPSLLYGIHARMEVKQQADSTLFQTLLLPYRCNNGAPDFPLIGYIETTEYVATRLHFYAPKDTAVEIPGQAKSEHTLVMISDSITDFHLSRISSGISMVTNPFNLLGNTAALESDAENVFISRGTYTYERPGACDPSIIAFKQAEIRNGTTLEYDDTVYISSGNMATIQYQYDGKFKYSGYVSSLSGATVTFFLPDLQQYFPMQGLNENRVILTTTHNSSSSTDY